jgi:hypothetical protein
VPPPLWIEFPRRCWAVRRPATCRLPGHCCSTSGSTYPGAAHLEARLRRPVDSAEPSTWPSLSTRRACRPRSPHRRGSRRVERQLDGAILTRIVLGIRQVRSNTPHRVARTSSSTGSTTNRCASGHGTAGECPRALLGPTVLAPRSTGGADNSEAASIGHVERALEGHHQRLGRARCSGRAHDDGVTRRCSSPTTCRAPHPREAGPCVRELGVDDQGHRRAAPQGYPTGGARGPLLMRARSSNTVSRRRSGSTTRTRSPTGHLRAAHLGVEQAHG